jgi:GTP-binding protein HflX
LNRTAFPEFGGAGRATRSGRTRAIVLQPVLRNGHAGDARTPAARLEESVGLARAIDLDVVAAETVTVANPRPATLLGTGAVERLGETIKQDEIALAIVGHTVSPVQQRNLEKAWNCKVIDRTGLILEIFGERARTREGQHQVELAALLYQRSRLVRSWTHLERQRGGFGFLGGPGESQLEMDRRLIDERIIRLKRELADVKRTRGLHRAARQRVPYPIVALVGYTNAGKSTLFNRLTRSDVVAADMLFATLDPTMRLIDLPSGQKAILSDTVGFISALPTHLVAAFRATLEEVEAADLILHVRDVSHPDTELQRSDVLSVLRDLGQGERLERDVIEALNKADLLAPEVRETLAAQTARSENAALISALDGSGVPELLGLIDRRLAADRKVAAYRVPHADGAAVSWLYNHGHVIDRQDEPDYAYIEVSLSPIEIGRFERLHPTAQRTAPAASAGAS